MALHGNDSSLRNGQLRARLFTGRIEEELQMIQVTIDLPEGVLASLHKDPQGFARELRLAAAVKWYEMKQISQARAAEIAGISRTEFIDALGRFKVTPFQSSADEIIKEAGRE